MCGRGTGQQRHDGRSACDNTAAFCGLYVRRACCRVAGACADWGMRLRDPLQQLAVWARAGVERRALVEHEGFGTVKTSPGPGCSIARAGSSPHHQRAEPRAAAAAAAVPLRTAAAAASPPRCSTAAALPRGPGSGLRFPEPQLATGRPHKGTQRLVRQGCCRLPMKERGTNPHSAAGRGASHLMRRLELSQELCRAL